MSDQPRGMARAALAREARPGLPAREGSTQIDLDTVRLPDGRAHIVDRRLGRVVGIAVDERIAERTRQFFS